MCCLLISSIIVQDFKVSAQGNTDVFDLRCEYKKQPIGIDVVKPRFSWKMSSDIRGQKQTAYQIIVASTQENADSGNGDIWDSGKVNSDKSVGIEYAGPELQSRMRYYWKVFVWDKDGNKISSDTTWFEMGLLDQQSDWQAKFISFDDMDDDIIDAYTIEVDFRIEQDVAGLVFGGKDSGNFLMWQINIFDYASDKKVYFRPHKWENGGAQLLEEKDISSVIPWEERFDKHHLKIEVFPSNEIVTSINGIEIDRRIDSMASFGQFGFRQHPNQQESAYFDNLVIMDDKGEVLFSEDFNSGINPFSVGEVIDGELFVKAIDVFMRSVELEAAPMFRKEFVVDENKDLKRARLYCSALGVYEAYINGIKRLVVIS